MRLVNRSRLLFAAVIATFFLLSIGLFTPVHAANPTTISFQGKVVNANGTNVTDGPYTFLFKLYTVSSAGSAIWTETQTSVAVAGGVFQVNLGSVCPFFTANACNGSTPIDFNANPALYLGITFNADPAGEMTPRVQLQSAPYAYNADKVGGLTAAQLVQLSPGSQQTGNISVSGTGTFGSTLTVSGAGTSQFTGALQSGSYLLGTGPDLSLEPIAGGQSALTSWWGLQLVGNKQSTVAYTPVNLGAAGAYGVLIPVQQAASIGLLLHGASGQSQDLLEVQNNGGTVLDKIDNVGNLTITGSSTSTTSVITPSLTTSGALVINSGAASNVTIDSAGAGTAAITIGGTNATSVAIGRTGQTTTLSGALAVNQNATFNGNVIMTFTGSENLAITSDLAGTVNGLSFIGTPSTTAGTTNGAFIQQAASANANGLDNALTIDNANTTLAIGAAINITNSGGGGYTNLISSPNFTVDGSGQILGKGVDYFDPSKFTGSTTTVGSGGSTGGNFGGAVSTGAFIGNTDTYDQEFIGSIAAATTNNANAGDDGLWYFNNNAQASMSGSDVSTTGGFYRIISNVTTARGGLLTEGSTPGTLDAPLLAANLPIVQMKVRQSALRTTDDMIWGMTDTTTAPVTNDAMPTNGIFFWSNNNIGTVGTDWQGVVRSGGVNVGTVNCPGTMTTNFATGRIVVDTTGSVTFFIDPDATNGISFQDCGTVTGTLPVANMAMSMYVAQTGVATANYDVDYARFWQDDSAPTDPAQAAADSAGEQMQADIATGTDTSAAVDSGQVTGTSDTTSDSATTTPDPTSSDSSPPIQPLETGIATNGDNLVADLASGGSFQILNSAGQQVATIDDNGNETLNGALNIASASVGGNLVVGGDSTFNGLSIFQKLATFIGKTIFRQDTQFDGHIIVASDSAGYASLRVGEISVHVTFSNPYDNPPVVSASITDGQFGLAAVNNVTTQGFDIALESPATTATTFSWIAVGVINPQTATNPLPATDQSTP